LDLRWPCW